MMATTALARVPLFAEVPADELAVLETRLHRRHFGKGAVIFLEGDPGSGLYVVEAGRVKIVLTSAEGKEVVLTMLGPADFFGDLALLDGLPRSADAVAQEPCRLLVLERIDFLHWIEAHPRVATRLLAVLSRRLRRNAQLLQDAAFHDVAGRLARRILELAETDGQPVGAGALIAARLTQSELAGMVGATRESVNKWLRSYERRGLIRCQRGQIAILKPAELRKYTD